MAITCGADVEKLRMAGKLTTAEEKLLDNSKAGKPTVLGQGERPQAGSDGRTVRAEFLRFLILGGGETCKVHERGVVLWGAWIEGNLDASFIEASGMTALQACVFEEKIEATGAEFRFLNLSASDFPGLEANGVKISGDLDLTGAVSRGTVSLESGSIGGEFVLDNAHLESGDGCCLYAQGVHVGTDVLLTDVSAYGEVNLVGAVIGGQVSCRGASFLNPHGKALNAFRMRVTESLYWRDLQAVEGQVDLSFAQIGDLIDDEESWMEVSNPVLVGLVYQNLLDPDDFEMRRTWLRKGSLLARGRFFPQPYLQLAKVMRETGHRTEARDILIEKEKEQGLAQRERLAAQRELRTVLKAYLDSPSTITWYELESSRISAGDTYKLLLRRFQSKLGRDDFAVLQEEPPPEIEGLWRFGQGLMWENRLSLVNSVLSVCGDRIYRYVSAYGYKPGRSVIHILILCAVLTVFVQLTWVRGGIVPASRSIVSSAEWTKAVAAGQRNPSAVWLKSEGVDYTAFNPVLYAADIFVPIINFGQTSAWAPSAGRSDWGLWLFRMQAFFKILGWAYSAILVAALSGKIRRAD